MRKGGNSDGEQNGKEKKSQSHEGKVMKKYK